jgi:hypothetical protein
MKSKNICSLITTLVLITPTIADETQKEKKDLREKIDYSKYEGENRPAKRREIKPDAIFKARMGKIIDTGLINKASKIVPEVFTEYAQRQKLIAKEVTTHAQKKKTYLDTHTQERVTIYTYRNTDKTVSISYFDREPFGFSSNDRLTTSYTKKEELNGVKTWLWVHSDRGLNGISAIAEYKNGKVPNRDMDRIEIYYGKNLHVPKIVNVSNPKHQKHDY